MRFNLSNLLDSVFQIQSAQLSRPDSIGQIQSTRIQIKVNALYQTLCVLKQIYLSALSHYVPLHVILFSPSPSLSFAEQTKENSGIHPFLSSQSFECQKQAFVLHKKTRNNHSKVKRGVLQRETRSTCSLEWGTLYTFQKCNLIVRLSSAYLLKCLLSVSALCRAASNGLFGK